jgi:hypothetical protein
LQINLAKYDDQREDNSKDHYMSSNNFKMPKKAWTAQNSEKKELPLETEPNERLETEHENPKPEPKTGKTSPCQPKSKTRISYSKATEMSG